MSKGPASPRSEISTATARSDCVRRSRDCESATTLYVSRAGDLDIVVGETTYVEGEWNTWLTYIENTGTSTAPVFVVRTGSANPFDGSDVGKYSAPALGDLDNDGTLRPRPSIDKLRSHVLCLSQATWTS